MTIAIDPSQNLSPSASLDPRRSFQGLILTLQKFWAEAGLRDITAL